MSNGREPHGRLYQAVEDEEPPERLRRLRKLAGGERTDAAPDNRLERLRSLVEGGGDAPTTRRATSGDLSQERDPFGRLYEAVGVGRQEARDPYGRLYQAVEGESSFTPPERPTPLRPDHMAAPGDRPVAEGDLAAMTSLAAAPDTTGTRLPPPERGGTGRGLDDYLASAGRSLARTPGRIIEGAGGTLQAVPDVADILGATGFGFRPAVDMDRLGPDSRVTEAAGEAVKSAGRGLEQTGAAMLGGPVEMTESERSAEMSDPLWWTSRVPEGVGQFGTQALLALGTGGSTALSRGLAFGATALPLEAGQHYIGTRERLEEEGASPEQAERQAAAQAAAYGPLSAAVEVGPGAAALRPLKKAAGPFSRRVMRMIGRNLALGPIEGAEEATQETVESAVSYAGGDETAFEDLGRRALESGAVGTAVGTIAGGARLGLETTARPARREEPAEQPRFTRPPFEPERRLQGVQTDEEQSQGPESTETPTTESEAGETYLETIPQTRPLEQVPDETLEKARKITLQRIDLNERTGAESEEMEGDLPGRTIRHDPEVLARDIEAIEQEQLRRRRERHRQGGQPTTRTSAEDGEATRFTRPPYAPARRLQGPERSVQAGEARLRGPQEGRSVAPGLEAPLSEAASLDLEVGDLNERMDEWGFPEVDRERVRSTVERFVEEVEPGDVVVSDTGTRWLFNGETLVREDGEQFVHAATTVRQEDGSVVRELQNVSEIADALGSESFAVESREAGEPSSLASDRSRETLGEDRLVGEAVRTEGGQVFALEAREDDTVALRPVRDDGTVDRTAKAARVFGNREEALQEGEAGRLSSQGNFLAESELQRPEEAPDEAVAEETTVGEVGETRLSGPERVTAEAPDGQTEATPSGSLRGPRIEPADEAFPAAPFAFAPGVEDAQAVVEGRDPLAPTPEPATGREAAPREAAAEPEQEGTPEAEAGTPIGGRMQGRLELPEDWEGGPVSRPQVRHELAKTLEAAGEKVPIRTGRVPGRSRGVFKVRPEVVRVRQAGDLPNAWHETAHALEKLVYGWPEGSPWQHPLVSERMQEELEALGRELYGDHRPAGGYKREGFAEFLKFWGTGDPRIESAPTFRRWFEDTFMDEHPEVADQLQRARNATTRWRQQGAAERARQSVVDPASPSRRLRQMWSKVSKSAILTETVEGLQPLYEMAERAEESLGRELDPSEHPYLLPAALATVESTRTKYMIQRGMIDMAGNRTGGPALVDVAELVKKAELPQGYEEFTNRQAFTVYLWARRTRALQTDPEGARESGMSLEDAEQILDELASEEFETAAGLWDEWNQGVLDYAAEASPTFAEIVERVRARDPGAYMPLQRVFENLDDSWSGTASGDPTSPVQRLEGSTRPIKDPIQMAIAQAESTMRAAHRRKTLDTIIRLSNVEGLGGLIEEVDRDVAPVATRDLSDVLDRIRRELADEADVEVTPDAGEGLDLTGRTLTFFAPARHPKGAEPIVPLFDGETGKVRWFRMDEDLMRSLEVLVPHRQADITGLAVVDEMMKKPTRAFRAGTTGLRASFGLVWNMLRDVQTLYVNSRSSAAGPRLFVEWLHGMVSAGLNKGTGGKVNAGEWADLYMRLGAEMSQSLGQDIPHTRAAARKLFQGRVVKTLDPRNWFEWYREFVQFPEAAPRIAELKTEAQDIGWEPGEPMTLDQSLHLLLSAKQVTTDFTAAGHFVRKLNQIVPFANASIQGPRANLRAARRNPRKFLVRGLSLTAATILLWWQYKDEEWWKRLDPREKFVHWHVPIDWPEKTLVRIPRAFEAGLAFSALPEALLDGWYQQDPEAVEEWFEVFRKAATPPVTPKPLDVVAEQLANENFFFDSPIVPMSLERKPAEEQYNEYTSRLAIELGDLFDASPKRIDHALHGVFGPMGQDLLEVLGMGPEDRGRERELADIPVAGRLFQRGGQFGRTKSVDKLYNRLGELQKVQASDRQEETESQRQARLLLSDASNALSALYFLRTHATSAERRRRLNELISQIAEDALRASDHPMELRARFKRLRHTAEDREEALERRLQGRPPEPDREADGSRRRRRRQRERRR